MTGKTHMSIGVGLTNVMIATSDIKTLLIGTILALVGSLIVDIDTEKSQGSIFLKNCIAGIIIVATLGLVLKEKYSINIFKYIIQNKELQKLIPILSILSIVIVIGVMSKHRSFTHSILGVIAFTMPMYIIVGDLAKWFAIGYIAHILADMLNKKGVKLLYPYKKGISLKLCKSDGIVDKILFISFLGITFLKYTSSLAIMF